MSLNPALNPCVNRLTRSENLFLRKTPFGWRLYASVDVPPHGCYSGIISFLEAPEQAQDEWR